MLCYVMKLRKDHGMNTLVIKQLVSSLACIFNSCTWQKSVSGSLVLSFGLRYDRHLLLAQSVDKPYV